MIRELASERRAIRHAGSERVKMTSQLREAFNEEGHRASARSFSARVRLWADFKARAMVDWWDWAPSTAYVTATTSSVASS